MAQLDGDDTSAVRRCTACVIRYRREEYVPFGAQIGWISYVLKVLAPNSDMRLLGDVGSDGLMVEEDAHELQVRTEGQARLRLLFGRKHRALLPEASFAAYPLRCLGASTAMCRDVLRLRAGVRLRRAIAEGTILPGCRLQVAPRLRRQHRTSGVAHQACTCTAKAR